MKKFTEVVEGVIAPISWDREGKVRRISVYTPEGRDIILRHHYRPKALASLINKPVRVFGRSVGSCDGSRLFSVDRIVKKRDKHFNHREDDFPIAA